MPKPIRNLTNMEIDEISLVDKGANQHAMITIAKRAPEEDQMPELYNESGQLLPEDYELTEGEIVFDGEGQGYEWVLDGHEVGEERETEMVGKSAFFDQRPSESGFAAGVMEELSKAFGDDERDAVIAKALGRVEELETQHAEYANIAKSERDLRLTREYVSKAAEYNLPVSPEDLGPVLYRMAETMDYDDCAVIAKCLETAGEMLFIEKGFQGGGENNDVFSMVQEFASEEIGKSASGGSREEAISKVFDDNPQAYDEYLAAQRTRF